MSYAAIKLVHAPTGVSACASAFLTHSPPSGNAAPSASTLDYAGGSWSMAGTPRPRVGNAADSLPNLVLVKANVIEVYNVRVQEGDEKSTKGDVLVGSASVAFPATAKRGGYMSGINAAWLELVFQYRLHGNIESMAVLSHGRDGTRRRRDAIILAFRDAKFSVLHFDDATQKLKTSSMHYFEGPDWLHLKRGREKFSRGPAVRADYQGRCAAVLIYDCQLIMMKAAQEGYGLGEEDEGSGGSISARIDSSYVVNLRELDMMHIKDFVFLHGYIEPVIVVLHEREPTWAGRIAYRRETCSITALSINASLKQHPRLWFENGLPYDAYSLLAVPSPIGGVLVLCANSILYYSQVSTCFLALNEFAIAPAGSGEMPKSKFSVELDAAHATWVSYDVALLTTKTGMLLLLSLVFDGRSVQKLELVRSKSSVLSSSICTIGDMFFFLGSRLGDSLLVQFTTGSSPAGAAFFRSDREEYDEIDGDVMAPSSKRMRLDSEEGDPADELPFYQYSSTSSDAPRNMNFMFAVRDSLVNIGPLRDIVCGSQNPSDLSGTVTGKQTNHELVACSGHGKNGGIAIFSRSIRPEFITQVELPGCKGVWTVYHKGGQANLLEPSVTKDGKDEYHAYLIISLESRTMVLETGETLGEVTDSVEYYTQGPTISAGNLFGKRRIAQVHQRGVRILDGASQTQDLKVLETGMDVVLAASFADPYIVLLMTDGSIQLAIGDPENFTISLSAPALSSSTDPITACTLYHDKGPNPWLRRTSGDVWQTLGVPDPNFGFDQGDTYCIVCRTSGRMELYELPNMVCVYRVEKFPYGLSIMADSRMASRGLSANDTSLAAEEGMDEIRDRMSKLKVVDLCMETWGQKYGRPFLFALLSDGTLLCYRAFCYEGPESTTQESGMVIDSDASSSQLKHLRFLRLQLDLDLGEEDGHEASSVQKIICFKDVGGLQGVFLTGAKPMWLMIFREQIRPHPQATDGPIVAFTSLHNVNCLHGFIYVTNQGFLKICRLPNVFNYDNDWPVQKIPLRGTPHQLTYHSDANLYALILSFAVTHPASLVLPSITDPSHQTEQPENLDGADAQKLVTIDEFEVRILNPTWETKATMKMQPTENALTIRIVNVKNTGTEQLQNLLAIGTAYVQGEDVAARGRIILVSVGPDPSDPSVCAKELYSKEHKGAISAVAGLQGHLLVAIGPKIILHAWNGSELIGTAFFDAPLYVVSLNIVKNFVLFGDFHKSVYFLCWKEEGAQLVLLAKDFGSLDCYATEFLIDGSTLSLLSSDSRKNIQVFSYAPKSVESWKGQKLLPRVEFHLGSHVAKFLRLQMLPTASAPRSNRFALCFGTLDGSIGYIAPLDELTFRRLQTLQRKLVDVVPHVAGLNPKAFRQFYSDGEYHRSGPDNTVDSEQLRHYETMALDQQIAIARQIGTTRQQIFANIRDLSLSTSFF